MWNMDIIGGKIRPCKQSAATHNGSICAADISEAIYELVYSPNKAERQTETDYVQ